MMEERLGGWLHGGYKGYGKWCYLWTGDGVDVYTLARMGKVDGGTLEGRLGGWSNGG